MAQTMHKEKDWICTRNVCHYVCNAEEATRAKAEELQRRETTEDAVGRKRNTVHVFDEEEEDDEEFCGCGSGNWTTGMDCARGSE